MSTKQNTTVAIAKTAQVAGISTRGSKKRAALGDISNQPAAVKAAKARKSTGVAPASTAASAPELSPDTIDLSTDSVPEPEVKPAPPAVADIYASGDASSYRELVSDFFTYRMELETATAIPANYMQLHQTDVTPAMRAILMDWLVEVAEEYKLHTETLFVCASYIDRAMCKFNISRANLQLLGCACMLLAAKYEEVYSPSVDEFVYISDNTYTREQVLMMESKVLNHLSFRLATTTARQFLHRFVKAAEFNDEQTALVSYLVELTLQEYDFLSFKPSVIAAAGVLYARILTDAPVVWTPALQHYTGYSASDLWECVTAFGRIHAAVPDNTLHAVRDKYSHTCHGRVSTKYFAVSPARLGAVKALVVPEAAPTAAAPYPAPSSQSSATKPTIEV